MSDTEPTPDELVSAYIDGELTDPERARVEADPVLREQVQRFLAVAEAVAAPVPPPPAGHRDRAIAAALEASSTAVNVASLDVARARRRSPRVVAIASVAAAVAVVLLVVPIVLSTRNGGEVDLAGEDTATVESADLDVAAEAGADEALVAPAEGEALEAAPPVADQEAATLEEEAPAEEEVPAEEPAEFDAEEEFADDGAELAPLDVVDLGEFAGLPELRSRILGQLTDLTGPIRLADECADELTERFDSSETELQVVAIAGGLYVISYVLVDPDGGAMLVVLDRETCSVLSTESL